MGRMGELYNQLQEEGRAAVVRANPAAASIECEHGIALADECRTCEPPLDVEYDDPDPDRFHDDPDFRYADGQPGYYGEPWESEEEYRLATFGRA